MITTISQEYDPYHLHSEYYVLMNEDHSQIVATSRKILFDESKGKNSFPMLDHEDELDQDFLSKLQEVGLNNTVEISALTKNPDLDEDNMATLIVYRQLFQDAMRNSDNERLFIMACSPGLFRTFKMLFDGAMQQVGPALDYPGQEAIPVMFDLRDGPISIIEMANDNNNPKSESYKHIVKFMLEGISKGEVAPEIVEALDKNGFENLLSEEVDGQEEITKNSLWSRRKPEVISGLGLLAYTAARTVAVAKGISPYSHVDWRVFLGIEVATTPTYVWGMGDLIRSILKPDEYSTRQKIASTTLAGSSLLAPYAYIAAEGSGMPEAAWIGFFTVAALSVAAAARRLVTKSRVVENSN